MTSFRHSDPAALRQPGSTATVLLILLTVLTGAGSPAPVRSQPTVTFPTTDQLVARMRGAGQLGVVAERAGALSGAQVVQAVARRERLSPAQRDRLDLVLAAALPTEQVYLAQAFAAGHTVSEIVAFAAAITGHTPHWLSTRLRPIDAGRSGPVHFRGNTISQYNDTTCGSTAIVVARARVDPLYAFRLTTGGRPGTEEESDESFLRRLRAEEQQVHDQTDVLWPQAAGTPPWGIAERLSGDAAGLGARYRWMPTVRGIPAFSARVLRQALTAANQGYPVPVLIGDVVPRHYVLLLRSDPSGASFYEPTAGEMIVVPAADVKRRDFSRLGYPRLEGVIMPTGPPIH